MSITTTSALRSQTAAFLGTTMIYGFVLMANIAKTINNGFARPENIKNLKRVDITAQMLPAAKPSQLVAIRTSQGRSLTMHVMRAIIVQM